MKLFRSITFPDRGNWCFTVQDKDFLSIKKHFTCLQKASRLSHPPEMDKSMLFSFCPSSLGNRKVVVLDPQPPFALIATWSKSKVTKTILDHWSHISFNFSWRLFFGHFLEQAKVVVYVCVCVCVYVWTQYIWFWKKLVRLSISRWARDFASLFWTFKDAVSDAYGKLVPSLCHIYMR